MRRAMLRWRAVVTALGLLLLAAVLMQSRSASAPAPALPPTYLDPASLPDGRIVYARSLAGTDGNGPTALYTARPDGSEERRITFGDARDRVPAVLPDGRIVFRRHSLDGGAGRLFAINPDGTGLQLFCDLADGTSVEGGPWLIDERVAFIEASGNGSRPQLAAVSVHQPAGKHEVLAEADTRADIDTEFRPIVLALGAAQAPPKARPPSLTSVVDERKSTGTLLCLDVRTSRLPALSAVKPGAIRTVRVLGADGQMLGEAPVAADGSFFVEVPADQPLHLELYGPDGVIAADDSGFWVRPNENRGCIGCHEDPELAPENRAILALAGGPTRVGTAALAMQAEARKP